jgi:hypothetical protein
VQLALERPQQHFRDRRRYCVEVLDDAAAGVKAQVWVRIALHPGVEVRKDIGGVMSEARGGWIEGLGAVAIATASHDVDHVLRRRQQRVVTVEADLAGRKDVLDANRVVGVPVAAVLRVPEDGLAAIRRIGKGRERRTLRQR